MAAPLLTRDAIVVTLSNSEAWEAVSCGVRRHLTAIHDNRQDRNGAASCDEAQRWGIDVEGAVGELVLAKHFGVYWNPTIGVVGRVDFPPATQVRVVDSPSKKLIIRRDANDEHVYVLVCGQRLKYEIVGWILARNAKVPAYLENPRGYGASYFVPREDLEDMSIFPLEAIGR
jgi:hypothetical protein